MSGSGISWAVCKSASRSRQIITPAPHAHHSVFYRTDALPAAQPTASKHWRCRGKLQYVSTGETLCKKQARTMAPHATTTTEEDGSVLANNVSHSVWNCASLVHDYTQRTATTHTRHTVYNTCSYSKRYTTIGWLGSRVVSVLDSGAEGPGFKSQSRRSRVTVLDKLFTHIVPLFTKQQNW